MNSIENPFYYLENFEQVLDWISTRYQDLLTAEERDFISAFPKLPQAARAVFVRMVMRKGEFFRASRLAYAEIGNTMDAVRPLLETGWVRADPELELAQVFDLLSKPEIARVFALPAAMKSARKAEQLAALQVQFADPRTFSAWFKDASDAAFHITVQALCDRLRLIFFGNAYQDWSEFVLSDLGIYQYERVEFTPASRGFRTRRDIEDFLALQDLKERFAEGEDVLHLLPSDKYDNEWMHSRRERLVFHLGQQFEKQKDWEQAQAAYARCAFPGARARLIRVLEKSEQFASAHQLLQQAMDAPESDAEHQQLLRIAPRLARKLGLAHSRKQARTEVETLALSLPFPEDACSVEEVVRRHLDHHMAPAFYVENALINGLFGLLCWRAIFCAIPGAFFHPFHRAPADLHSADFVGRRAALFAACFAELDNGQYKATIRRHFADKSGIQSPFLLWEFLSHEVIELALDCIPPRHLLTWFERILSDIKDNRAGFPDLIQFWPAEHRYKMIEVKGPGDRLQDNQLRWIDHCQEHGMPIAVCYLQWE